MLAKLRAFGEGLLINILLVILTVFEDKSWEDDPETEDYRP